MDGLGLGFRGLAFTQALPARPCRCRHLSRIAASGRLRLSAWGCGLNLALLSSLTNSDTQTLHGVIVITWPNYNTSHLVPRISYFTGPCYFTCLVVTTACTNLCQSRSFSHSAPWAEQTQRICRKFSWIGGLAPCLRALSLGVEGRGLSWVRGLNPRICRKFVGPAWPAHRIGGVATPKISIPVGACERFPTDYKARCATTVQACGRLASPPHPPSTHPTPLPSTPISAASYQPSSLPPPTPPPLPSTPIAWRPGSSTPPPRLGRPSSRLSGRGGEADLWQIRCQDPGRWAGGQAEGPVPEFVADSLISVPGQLNWLGWVPLLRTSAHRNFGSYFGTVTSQFSGEVADVAIIWAGNY